MSLPDHADRPSRYTWDTAQLFEQPSDWTDARDALSADLDTDDPPATPLESAGRARELVDTVADWYRRKQRLELYATLRDCISEHDTASDRMAAARELSSQVETAVANRLDRLRRTDETTLDRIETALDERTHYFASLRRQAHHRRDPEREEVIERFAEQRSSADRIVRAVTNEDVEPPTVETPDGGAQTVTQARHRQELSRTDRAYRRRVYEAYLDELSRFEGTLATAYHEKLSAASALAAVRGFDSVRALQLTNRSYPESGLEVRFPPACHDTMIESVADSLGPRERARELRADRLGIETVRPWDTEVSLADAPEPELSYDEAVEHVVAAFAPLGEGYQERARQFFDQRRVDVYECADKRGDIPAFCPSSADDGAYVLLNYQRDVRTAYYCCHELGHALHVEHYRREPTMYATGPRPISELPSLLHEILLTEHLAADGGPLGAHARNRLLDSLDGMLYGQAATAAFKRRLAAAVDDGETLSADRIADAYRETQARFDPALEQGERTRYEWLTGALYRDAFHHYQYVLGAVGALHVRESLRDDDLDPATYSEFLRSTGRERPLDLFERFGLDLRTSDPYERATTAFGEYVTKWE
mgnify:CR=1 FL=1